MLSSGWTGARVFCTSTLTSHRAHSEAFQTEPMTSSKYLLGSGAYGFVPSGHLSTKAKVLPPQETSHQVSLPPLKTTIWNCFFKIVLTVELSNVIWIQARSLSSVISKVMAYLDFLFVWYSVLQISFLIASKRQHISTFEVNWAKKEHCCEINTGHQYSTCPRA